MKISTWLVDANKPFDGTTQSYLLADGTVAYTDGMTVAQYEASRSIEVKAITDAELDALLEAHYRSKVTAPKAITADEYDDALNVLPPSKWHSIGAGWY